MENSPTLKQSRFSILLCQVENESKISATLNANMGRNILKLGAKYHARLDKKGIVAS
jgi:hypothetical protein